MADTFLKISNRNYIIKRNCFELFAICFYEIDSLDPNCIDINAQNTNPPSPISTSAVFKDLSHSNAWTPTPEIMGIDSLTGIKCYEPYQQSVVFDISQIEFTAIALGLLQPISNDTVGTNESAPRYWSIAFGDKAVVNNEFNDDTLFDQYWVIDLKSEKFVNLGTKNQPFLTLNPLFFMFDTRPLPNTIRMNEVFKGRPEQYVSDLPLFRFGGLFPSEPNRFSTWAWIGSSESAIYDNVASKLDNSSLKIGQFADIACKSAMNYNYAGMDSFKFISATTSSDKCYGTAGEYGIITVNIEQCVVEKQIYYPPMAWRVESNENNAICNVIAGQCEYCSVDMSNVENFDECTSLKIKQCDGPSRSGNDFAQCDAASDISQPAAADDVPYYFECAIYTNMSQINTAFPTILPTNSPTLLPSTANPSFEPTLEPTLKPTQAPYTPGTPSRAPITFSPTMTPSIVPSQSTQNPSLTPTNYPTMNPSIDPTMYPTNAPILTMSPTADEDIDGNGDDRPIFEVSGWKFGLIEVMLILIVLCICYCLCFMLWLMRKNKNIQTVDAKGTKKSNVRSNEKDSDEEDEDEEETQTEVGVATFGTSTRGKSFHGTQMSGDENGIDGLDDDLDGDVTGFGTTAKYMSTRQSLHSNYSGHNGIEMEDTQRKTSYNV